MSNIRCKTCTGSGKVMGGGMIIKDCDVCNGNGTVAKNPKFSDFKIDRESKHYKKAIKNIKSLNTSFTDEDAEVIFEKELDRIEKEEFLNEIS